MKPIKLSELIEALEFDSDERVTRVDLQNGCVVSVDRSFLSALVEGDEEALSDLPDWLPTCLRTPTISPTVQWMNATVERQR